MEQPDNPPPIVPPAGNWNHSAGRRKFLAGTGKAGAMTILALHGLRVEVLATKTPSADPDA